MRKRCAMCGNLRDVREFIGDYCVRCDEMLFEAAIEAQGGAQ